MAWSNGNLRWQLQFASRSNVACRVDIYKRDYTGSTVTQLTGAATPVYWDEDDDDDLLNVIRVKTGYISVIENTYHELDTLHPSTDIDHYVEVYYGTTLAFTGFMKAQSFDAPYAPGPRIIKLPITSPLGVAEGIRMTALSQPTYITLGGLIYRVIGKLPADITQVIFPTSIVIDTNYSVDLMWKLLTLTYCNYNSDYDNYKEHEQEVFVAESVEYAIDAICNCLGLMCHDFPGLLVFTKVDYSGTYGVYTSASLLQDNITPTTTIDSSIVTDYSDTPILSDKGKEMHILPIKKLTINYKDDFEKKVELMSSFDYSKFWTWIETQTQGKNITYKKFDPSVDSAFWNTGYFPMDDLTPPPYGEDYKHGLWFAEFGTSGMTKKILYRALANTETTRQILTWKLWKVPPLGSSFKYIFTMNMEKGTGTMHLEKASGVTIYLRFKLGDQYWNGSAWVTTSSYVSVTSDQDGKIRYAIPQLYSLITPPKEMTIEILAGDMASMEYLYSFTDICFGSGSASEIFDTVLPDPLLYKEIQEDNGSVEEDNISANMNVAVNNFSQLISPTDGVSAVGQPSSYAYLFQSRMRTIIDTLIAISPNIYLQKVKFITEYPRRKIISCGFTPSEDEMQISMQSINSL